MTDPVNGISGTQGTPAGGSYSGGSSLGGHNKKKAPQQADLIEISQDARDRSKGKTRKSLLEYLKELLG